MLLVLDNMEQLVEAAADIGRLLALAPPVTVLATSREALGVSGEQLVAVPPLVLPDRDDEPEVALARPAVRLFVDRARAADPGFQVTDQDVGVVSDICRRLDGLPLTIELAAPLTTTLTLRALLERLDRPVALLVDHRRGSDQPGRHRSLRGALGSSVDGLTPVQRRAFEQLSVFVSGASLDAVEAVTGLGAGAVDALVSLRERNLVYRSDDRTAPRFRQLETVRDYAAEQLAADPASFATTVERHTSYVRLLAERVSREARSRTSSDLIGLLRDEQDEVRSVLARLADRGDGPGALRLVTVCL